jgi:hypothetical protein
VDGPANHLAEVERYNTRGMDKPHGQQDENETRSGQGEPGADTWLSAWRGLRDNPLARYLPLMEKRRERQGGMSSWFARRMGMLAVISGVAVLAAWFGVRGAGLAPWEHWVALGAAAVLPAFMVWYFHGLYTAFQASLSTLNRKPGTGQASLLDDALCMSQLTDREIVVGLARVIVPALLVRIAVAAIVLHGCTLFIAYMMTGVPKMARPATIASFSGDYGSELSQRELFWQASRQQVFMHVTILLLSVGVAGSLCALTWVLWLLFLGRRNISQASIGVELIVLLLVQGFNSLFLLFLVLAQFAHAHFLNRPDKMNDGWAIVGSGVFLGIFIGASLVAQKVNRLRNALPIILPLLFVGAGLFFFFSCDPNIQIPRGVARSEYALQVSYSALCLGNAQAVPNTKCMGNWSYDYTQRTGGYKHYWRIEAFTVICIQLMLLPFLLWLARDSVRRYRQAAE